jgi:hypothetical protein
MRNVNKSDKNVLRRGRATSAEGREGGSMGRGHEKCVQYSIFVGKPEGKRTLGRPRPNGMIILKWILKKWVGC